MADNIKLNLAENAKDSLIEGLKKFQEGTETNNPRALKFAILCFTHFLELQLKVYIASINTILIYKEPFSEKFSEKFTISLTQALYFIKNTGVDIIRDDGGDGTGGFTIKDVKDLQKLRNDISHYEFQFNPSQVKKIIRKIISIVRSLPVSNIENNIEKLIPSAHLVTYRNILKDDAIIQTPTLTSENQSLPLQMPTAKR